MADLRSGELVVQSAGGICAVCRQRIPSGPAVQLSSQTSRIRHVECVPKTDSRSRGGFKTGRKLLPE